jgi:diguanylate cyclase (GGDEF)-like protein
LEYRVASEETGAGQGWAGSVMVGPVIGNDAVPIPGRAGGEPAILRIIAPLALIVVAATVVCAVLGFVLARQADDYFEAEHRRALRGAVEALQAVSPDLSHVDPQLIHILERASGLKGLKFDVDPPAGEGEVQPMAGANGRIVGWFSWQPERPATALILRLLPFAAAIALGLFCFAGLAMWQLKRLGLLLARSEQQVRRLVYEDTLTGLPNHHETKEYLDRVIAARKPDETLAFAILDVDGFDDMRDVIGEAGANEVIVEIANRLRQGLPSDVLVGRLDNDKFSLSMTAAEPAAVLEMAEAARDTVCRSIWINQVVHVSACVGIALVPDDAATRDDLKRRADLALRAAKRRGRGQVARFAEDMEADFHERRFIKRELPRALTARAFDLHYQPIVTADGVTIVGVEALLRWEHPSRGFIPPSLFIPVAEQIGLMEQLGEFVLQRALSDAARWPDLYVSVNLSPTQVRDRTFADLLKATLDATKISPSRVVLEVTESVLIDNPDAAKSRLQDLRALGVRLALDDFGSGYSSLTYLQRLPFDKLKIDRAFVEALDQSANAGVIIQAIVALGRALGLSVVIEGVETEEQRVLLRLAGCNEMQGYLFARPAPREAIDQLLAGIGAIEGGPRTLLRAG